MLLTFFILLLLLIYLVLFDSQNYYESWKECPTTAPSCGKQYNTHSEMEPVYYNCDQKIDVEIISGSDPFNKDKKQEFSEEQRSDYNDNLTDSEKGINRVNRDDNEIPKNSSDKSIGNEMKHRLIKHIKHNKKMDHLFDKRGKHLNDETDGEMCHDGNTFVKERCSNGQSCRRQNVNYLDRCTGETREEDEKCKCKWNYKF